MAITISILNPHVAPTLNTATVVSGGGSLMAGTYEVCIYTADDSDGKRRSACSNVITGLVTNSGDSISLNYTLPADSGVKIIYVYRLSSSGTTAYKRWCSQSYGYSAATYPTTFTITAKNYNHYSIMENFTLFNGSFFGLKTNKGSALIDITATSTGTVTVNDINTALNASSLVAGDDYIDMAEYALVTTARIYLHPTYDVTFDIKGKFIMTVGGVTSNSHVLFSAAGTYVPTFIGVPKRGGWSSGIWLYKYNLKNTVVSQGLRPTFMEGTGMIAWNDSLSTGYNQDGMVNSGYDTISAQNSNSLVYGMTRAWKTTYDNLVLINGSNMYVRCSYHTKIYNSKHYCSASYQIFWLPNYTDGHVDFYDTEWYNNSTRAFISYENMNFYDYNHYATKTGAHLNFWNTVKITFTDGKNDLSGVKVVITNTDGDEAYNETSDSNGEVEEYMAIFKHNNIPSEATGINRGIDKSYNPFTIKITKKGYQTQIIKDYTVSKKIDWTIKMKRSDVNIDSEVLA